MTEKPTDHIKEYLQRGDAFGWFDELYTRANGDMAAVPWDNGQPHPTFLDWLERQQPALDGTGQTALVVGCGLGHDAEQLARLGFEVTACDVSETAIKWARSLHRDSQVAYHVADMFHPPEAWLKAFDFVLEVYIVQALPPEMHEAAMKAVAQFVAPGGRLLAISIGREEDVPPKGPPWHMARSEFAGYTKAGLKEIKFEDFHHPLKGRQFRIEYGREV